MSAGAEQDIVVENPAVTAIFSTRGAVLKSWRLKNYRDGLGAPLELIPQNVPERAETVHPRGRRCGDVGDAEERAVQAQTPRR